MPYLCPSYYQRVLFLFWLKRLINIYYKILVPLLPVKASSTKAAMGMPNTAGLSTNSIDKAGEHIMVMPFNFVNRGSDSED